MSKIEFDDMFVIKRLEEEKLDIRMLANIIPSAQYQRIYDKLMLEIEFWVQTLYGHNKRSNFNFSKVAVTLDTARQSACFSVE